MTIISSPVVFPEVEDGNHTREGTPTATWSLALRKGATSSIRLNHGEFVHVHGKNGLLWISIEGDRKDYALVAGDSVTFNHTGLIVLEGLEAVNEAMLLLQASI